MIFRIVYRIVKVSNFVFSLGEFTESKFRWEDVRFHEHPPKEGATLPLLCECGGEGEICI